MSNTAKSEEPSAALGFIFIVILGFLAYWLFSPSDPQTPAEVKAAISKLKPSDHKERLELHLKLVELSPESALAQHGLEKAQRAVTIRSGFSGWNGAHYELEKIVKAAMNDPASYEHIETKYVDKGDYLLLITHYRGKNAFGGKVASSTSAQASIDGKVIKVF